MKEELQGKLVEILTSIQTAAGKASDFALEQLPDIAQSYVAYGRAYTALAVVIALFLLVSAVWLLRKGVAVERASTEQRREDRQREPNRYHSVFDYASGLPYFLGAVPPSILGVLLLATNLNGGLLVWLAPKVWLLKEIATLLK